MHLIIACLLALLLVLPPDALRYELLRALRKQPGHWISLIGWRLLVTVPLALLLAWTMRLWAGSNPAGPAMVVFSGVLAAAWLWMRFWIRTFIADPDHPLFSLRPTAIVLGTLLSLTFWLALFTQAALMVAWLGHSAALYGAVLAWPLADALWLAWGRRSGRAGQWLVTESTQRRLGRVLGTALIVLAGWAMWVVLARG